MWGYLIFLKKELLIFDKALNFRAGLRSSFDGEEISKIDARRILELPWTAKIADVLVLALCQVGLVSIGVAVFPLTSFAAPQVQIPMTAAQWQASSGTTFERQAGFPAGMMTLKSGVAVLKEAVFANGTIEFDMKALGKRLESPADRRRKKANARIRQWPIGTQL